tara:strand:+ start:1748 stop:1900 length:153 start_codon:yes stop_codon:yes gene_type:complete
MTYIFINLTVLGIKKSYLSGNLEKVKYFTHWPETILLFSIAANQIQNKSL